MTQTGERHNLSKPLVLECAKIKKGRPLPCVRCMCCFTAKLDKETGANR